VGIPEKGPDSYPPLPHHASTNYPGPLPNAWPKATSAA